MSKGSDNYFPLGMIARSFLNWYKPQLTYWRKNHNLIDSDFIIQIVEFRGSVYIIMENESNYDLYTRLSPRCWSEALVAKAAENELKYRAIHGDGEARMLLELHQLEPAKKPLFGHAVHSRAEKMRSYKFIYTLHLKFVH